MNFQWKFLGFFSIIIIGTFLSMGETVDGNENEDSEKGSNLVRKKRFICGGFCIATVVFGVVSMVGLGTNLANKEQDGAYSGKTIDEDFLFMAISISGHP